MFHSAKYLMPGCEIRLRLLRNTDDFVLLGATKLAKINIKDLYLQVRKLTVEESLVDRIDSTLTSKPAILPVTNGKVRNFTIYKGTKTERVNRVFTGILPRSIIFTFVKTDGFDGAVSVNPFIFEHFNLEHFQVYINGEPHFPIPLQPDFATGKFCREYRHFLDNIGLGHSDHSVDISMEQFKTSKFFIPIDFTPNLSNGFDLTPPRDGVIDVSVSFKEQLAQNITLLAYANFTEIMTIDKDKKVVYI